jgi:hypothetical protein
MATIVPSISTPVSIAEASRYLRDAVLRAGGDEVAARFIIAQGDLETGRFRSMRNYNLGNLRGSYQGMTTSIPGATEYNDEGVLVEVPHGFRAYPSFEAAADDKVSLIKRRYPNAWTAQNAVDYVDGLWRGVPYGTYFGVPPNDPFGEEGRKARDRYEAVLRERYALLFYGGSGDPSELGEGETERPKAVGEERSPSSSSRPAQRLLRRLSTVRVASVFDVDLPVLEIGMSGSIGRAVAITRRRAENR